MEAEFNGLPLYKAVFPEEADGILRVSLVDMPAVAYSCSRRQWPYVSKNKWSFYYI